MPSKTYAPRDDNRIVVLIGVASQTITIGGVVFIQGETPVPIAVNPSTGAIIVQTS